MSIGLLPGMQLLFSDIMLEVMDPSVIPPAVKPTAVSTNGAAATDPAMSNKRLDKEYDWRALTGFFQFYTRNSE